jgi:chromosome segregation ATPase
MSHKIKINFLRTVNTQKTEAKKEIGIRLDGLSRQLLANPKASYTFSDIANILDDAKSEMITLNDRIFDTFSKSFLGLLGVSAGEVADIGGQFDPEMEAELDALRLENQKMKSELEQLRSLRPTSDNEQIIELQKRLGNAEIEIERKEVEIQKLKIQLEAARSSATDTNTAQSYVKQINKIRTELDLVVQERDALQGSVRRLEATLKNNERDLQDARDELIRKNAEIDSLASKLSELSEIQAQNEQLKEAVIKAGEKIKQLTRELDDIKDEAEREIRKAHEDSKQEILSIQKEMDDLKRNLEHLEDEKELLLIDSQETTQAVQYYKDLANNSQNEIKKLKAEVDGLEQQLQMIMAGQAITQTPTTSVQGLLEEIEHAPSEVEIEEQKHMKETIAQLKMKETSLNDKILELENKVTDLTSEIDLKDKQIGVHVNRVKELQKMLNSLKVEIEDIRKERDDIENKFQNKEIEFERLSRQFSNVTKEKERIERETARLREELEETLLQQLEITERTEQVEKELNENLEKLKSQYNREKKVSDFFRRELERMPKYVILFVLNEVRKAKLEELQRTIHRPALWVKREVQSLVQEGWVEEIEGGQAVALIKNFPPV